MNPVGGRHLLPVALLFGGHVARNHGSRLLLASQHHSRVRLLFQGLALEGLTINAEEQLAFDYILSFGEGNAVDLSRNARLYINAIHCLDIADRRDFHGNVSGNSPNGANRYRLRRARLGRYPGAGRHKKTSWKTNQHSEQQSQYL